MTITRLILSTFILILFSCNNVSDTKARYLDNNKTKVEPKKNKKSCLEEYAMKPCDLLDLNKVARIANVDPSILELKPPHEQLPKSSIRVCKYTWSTGRKTKAIVAGRPYELDADNDILIGMFKILDSEKSKMKTPYTAWFDNAHRQMTEEESEKLRESAREKFNEDESKDILEVGNLLLDGVIDIGKKDVYINVDGMGDRASARINGMSPDVYLDILDKNLTFRIVVNVSNDKNENFELAKKLGAEILAICD